MSTFKDSDFISFAKQCKDLSLDNWEFYVKTQEFTIYRQLHQGLYRYRSIGTWTDIKADTLAHVYLDLEFRKQWDKNMLGYQLFEGGTLFQMKYPWPLAHRDYAYVIEKRKVQDDQRQYQVILGQSLPASVYPEQKGVVRIDDYMQHICITATEDTKGCHIFMDYFDDPKGNIPKAILNWAAKTGVPAFIDHLKHACRQYERDHGPILSSDDTHVLYL
ncbi:hypothetical protein EDC96DRAFT_451753 [Choanephora cucurbitarum]|nr:hypothetical protein EDC96DRAFT_451753 [Choanephora cucurbitarum]